MEEIACDRLAYEAEQNCIMFLTVEEFEKIITELDWDNFEEPCWLNTQIRVAEVLKDAGYSRLPIFCERVLWLLENLPAIKGK